MPGFVEWLVADPVRWVTVALLVAAVLGAVVNAWWEDRDPSSYTRRRRRELEEPSLMRPGAAPTAYETAVRAGSTPADRRAVELAAARILRAESARARQDVKPAQPASD